MKDHDGDGGDWVYEFALTDGHNLNGILAGINPAQEILGLLRGETLVEGECELSYNTELDVFLLIKTEDDVPQWSQDFAEVEQEDEFVYSLDGFYWMEPLCMEYPRITSVLNEVARRD